MAEFFAFAARIYVICIVATTVRRGSSTNPVCNTLECKNLGDAYLKNMDQTTSPCTDFYKYVCNRWPMQNRRGKWNHLWTTERAMKLKMQADLKDILETVKPKDLYVAQTQALFRACMHLQYFPMSDPTTVQKVMRQIGNWPMFLPENTDLPKDITWWKIDNHYVQITSESALFDVSLVNNADKKYEVITLFKGLFSPYGAIVRSTDWGFWTKEKDHYKAFLKKVIESVAPVDPSPFKSVIEKDLNDVISFRDELRKIYLKTKNDSPDFYLKNSISTVQTWYNTQDKSKDTAMISWLSFVRAVYTSGRDSQNKEIEPSTIITVYTNYTVLLASLLGRTSKRVIVNHIHLYFAERNLQLRPDMEEELKQSVRIADYPKNMVRYRLSRLEWCILSNNMGRTMGRLYVAAKFPPARKRQVESIGVEAKKILQKQIKQSTWLTNTMRDKSLHMAKKIEFSIGYPENYVNPEADIVKKSVTLDPIEFQMCHITPSNEIYISAAYLQPPIFNPRTPYVIEYGSTYAMIGHEVYHTFCEHSLVANKNGSTPLWPSDMYSEFKKHKKCFQDQYQKYQDKELREHNLRRLAKLPSTVDEDIADVMGLKLAYEGFKETLSKNKGVCHILPGFEKIGCEKLFFIAFGNTFCLDSTPGTLQQLFLADVHSTAPTRLNGAVANMKEFSDAFGCKPKDPLNIEKRCDLWH